MPKISRTRNTVEYEAFVHGGRTSSIKPVYGKDVNNNAEDDTIHDSDVFKSHNGRCIGKISIDIGTGVLTFFKKDGKTEKGK